MARNSGQRVLTALEVRERPWASRRRKYTPFAAGLPWESFPSQAGVTLLIHQYANQPPLDVMDLEPRMSCLGKRELADHSGVAEGIGMPDA